MRTESAQILAERRLLRRLRATGQIEFYRIPWYRRGFPRIANALFWMGVGYMIHWVFTNLMIVKAGL